MPELKNEGVAQSAEVMWTYYDFQSNAMLSNRMYQKPDETVAVVSMMSH
ncbi:MAG: hypothetical protein IJZ06_08255 [Bacteroidales bacterium]|nr:hypothetical protein [Bacteroidales bacterium]